MAKVIEKSAKTVEDALKAALKELGVSENEVHYEVIEEASKGFLGIIGTKPAKIRVTLKENDAAEESQNKAMNSTNKSNEQIAVTEKKIGVKKETITKKNEQLPANTNTDMIIGAAEKFLQDIFKHMNLNVKIESKELEEGQMLNLYGENLGVLIGKHGQTLDALQYLVNLAANRHQRQRIHFIIDVENYRGRRTETLQNLAKTLADKAVRLNQDVRLEPMNRHERKVIHTALQDNDSVSTYSVGEDPSRYIIISPKKYEKGKK